ncbi:MAG: hypothetical protein V7K53_28015 [Nostoc sp.]|uniref:hypothetical protein n=1 Tax=Nostoc sp. TaxID=1180 RepID=UPI002FFB1514
MQWSEAQVSLEDKFSLCELILVNFLEEMIEVKALAIWSKAMPTTGNSWRGYANAYALFSSLRDAERVRLIEGSVKFLTAIFLLVIFLLAMNSCYIVL